MTAVSFAGDVSRLFGEGDLRCMGPRGVALDDFAYMADAAGDMDHPDHANARHVLARLKGDEVPRMPFHAPAWPDDKIATFEKWISDGFQP